MSMLEYQPPQIAATFDVATLVSDAATCVTYSDESLKEDIRPVQQPLTTLRNHVRN
jgi:hypothetical protein